MLSLADAPFCCDPDPLGEVAPPPKRRREVEVNTGSTSAWPGVEGPIQPVPELLRLTCGEGETCPPPCRLAASPSPLPGALNMLSGALVDINIPVLGCATVPVDLGDIDRPAARPTEAAPMLVSRTLLEFVREVDISPRVPDRRTVVPLLRGTS